MDQHPGYIEAMNAFKHNILSIPAETPEKEKKQEALEVMIDALCRAGFVRRVEVTREECSRVLRTQCGTCVTCYELGDEDPKCDIPMYVGRAIKALGLVVVDEK